MSTRKHHDLPSPSSPQIGEDASSKNASVRLMRKRELDRKSQRMARDRTKNRMAYLEEILEQFKQRDTSGHVEVLMNQVAELEKDRDNLARLLMNIKKMSSIRSGVDENHSGPVDTTRSSPPIQHDSIQDVLAESDSWEYSLIPEFSVSGKSISGIQSPHQQRQLHPDPNEESHFDPKFDTSDSRDNGCLQASPFGMVKSAVVYPCSFVNQTSGSPFDTPAWDPIIPPAQDHCECLVPTYTPPQHFRRRNLWRFANETLTSTKVPNIQQMISGEDGISAESIAVEAVLNGWDSVAHVLPQYASWQALRKLDEEMFPACGKVERLAILLIMYRLLQYHSLGSPGRLSKVPSWYLDR